MLFGYPLIFFNLDLPNYKQLFCEHAFVVLLIAQNLLTRLRGSFCPCYPHLDLLGIFCISYLLNPAHWDHAYQPWHQHRQDSWLNKKIRLKIGHCVLMVEVSKALVPIILMAVLLICRLNVFNHLTGGCRIRELLSNVLGSILPSDLLAECACKRACFSIFFLSTVGFVKP